MGEDARIKTKSEPGLNAKSFMLWKNKTVQHPEHTVSPVGRGDGRILFIDFSWDKETGQS